MTSPTRYKDLPTIVIEHEEILATIRNDDNRQQIEPEEAAFCIEYKLSKQREHLISMASVTTLNNSKV